MQYSASERRPLKEQNYTYFPIWPYCIVPRGFLEYATSREAFMALQVRLASTLSICLLLAIPATESLARGSGGHSSSGHSSSHTSSSHSTGRHSYQTHPSSKTAPGVQRDSRGHIKRSPAAKDHFKKSHPCPSTGKSSGACPGYVIDHVVPLKRGGKDAPENMQWQTKEAAKAKDKIE